MVNRSMTTGDPVPRGDRRSQLRQLAGVPTLGDAPRELLSDLLDLGHVVRIRPRWAMLTEGTVSDKAYVLLAGEVAVHRGTPSAGTDLGHCRPGEFLGELGIVRHRLRSATVVSYTEVLALHLERAVFERLHAAHPYFRTLVGEAVLRKTA